MLRRGEMLFEYQCCGMLRKVAAIGLLTPTSLVDFCNSQRDPVPVKCVRTVTVLWMRDGYPSSTYDYDNTSVFNGK